MEPATFKNIAQTTQVVQPTTLLAITDRAAAELKTAMGSETQTWAGLRLGLEAGGCSGYQYALSFAKGAEPSDVVTESNGIKIFVDQKDTELVRGATVDYVDTPMGSGFHVKNPNAKSTCGCGNSFEG